MNNSNPFIVLNSGGARSQHMTLKAITIAVRISIEPHFAILLEICDPGCDMAKTLPPLTSFISHFKNLGYSSQPNEIIWVLIKRK